VWESLPPGTCDWVDLEIEETSRINPQTLDALRSSGVKILLSHHAFVPEEAAAWPGILDAMRALKPDGVKFAVALSGAAHAEALLDFARGVGFEYPDSCVLGMGPAGSLTRLVSPLLGCPYTYGFLGEGAVAPGQLSAEVMTAFFDRAYREPGRPAVDASSAAWLAWSEGLLKKVAGG
jgi:3-dehydroquinate dehydratase type I